MQVRLLLTLTVLWAAPLLTVGCAARSGSGPTQRGSAQVQVEGVPANVGSLAMSVTEAHQTAGPVMGAEVHQQQVEPRGTSATFEKFSLKPGTYSIGIKAYDADAAELGEGNTSVGVEAGREVEATVRILVGEELQGGVSDATYVRSHGVERPEPGQPLAEGDSVTWYVDAVHASGPEGVELAWDCSYYPEGVQYPSNCEADLEDASDAHNRTAVKIREGASAGRYEVAARHKGPTGQEEVIRFESISIDSEGYVTVTAFIVQRVTVREIGIMTGRGDRSESPCILSIGETTCTDTSGNIIAFPTPKGDPLRIQSPLYVWFVTEPIVPSELSQLSLSDDCGGTASFANTAGKKDLFAWRPPADADVCNLTLYTAYSEGGDEIKSQRKFSVFFD